MSAKQLRLRRFLNRTSCRGVIVPIDHGLTMGPIEGLENTERIAAWIGQPGIDGVIAHKGMAERLTARGLLDGVGLMVHLNGMHAMALDADSKELVTTVKAAVRLGADAVSLQLNFDGRNDANNLKMLGAVADEAADYGLPVLTMLYDKKTDVAPHERVTRLRHLMRLTVELGTDALKIGAPDRLDLVPEILASLSEDVPVFFAGGSKATATGMLALAGAAARHGAAGLCVGRNVFQRADPGTLLAQLATVLHGNDTSRGALMRPRLASENHLGVH